MNALSLRSIYKMTDAESRQFLADARWSASEPICPKCKFDKSYDLATRQVYKCKACYRQYSVTSESMFASRKLPCQDLIAAAFIFVSANKGISSCQLARTCGMDQGSAWHILRCFREAIEVEVDQLSLEGIVEIDGATFGGHRRHANMAQDFSGNFKRFQVKHTKNKRVVVVAKQRGGRTIPFVHGKESEAFHDITRVVADGAIIQADEARAWDSLNKLFDMMRIKHSYAFSANQACTNNAESFFSQFRKAHNGTHHWFSGDNMRKYACEVAWKRDFAEWTVEQRTIYLLHLCLVTPKTRKWRVAA